MEENNLFWSSWNVDHIVIQAKKNTSEIFKLKPIEVQPIRIDLADIKQISIEEVKEIKLSVDAISVNKLIQKEMSIPLKHTPIEQKNDGQFGIFMVLAAVAFLLYWWFNQQDQPKTVTAQGVPQKPEVITPTVKDENQGVNQKASTKEPWKPVVDQQKAKAESDAKAKLEAEAKAKAEAEAKAKVEAEAEEAKAKVEAYKRKEADDFERGQVLKAGLAKTQNGFIKKLFQLFKQQEKISDDLIYDLEEALLTADIGVSTAQKLIGQVENGLSQKELKSPTQVWNKLKNDIIAILNVDTPPLELDKHKPTVIMVVGVNGAGKTTSIGKLARKYSDEGKKVVLAAGDTFRAAAVEQLAMWGERSGVEVIYGKDKQDPSSVIFDACKKALESNADIILADTAGRLQSKQELMDELAKVHRVINKAIPGAPHEVWLVLDATNGQNAISQAKIFTEKVAVSGVILTKLDGTAKGGVIVGIRDEMKLPIRYIGVGERVTDLQEFNAQKFVEALFSNAEDQ